MNDCPLCHALRSVDESRHCNSCSRQIDPRLLLFHLGEVVDGYCVTTNARGIVTLEKIVPTGPE